MPAAPAVIFVACLLAHDALALLLPPWWVPDLTLVGLVTAAAWTRPRWAGYALAAAWFASLWAVRSAELIFLGYFAVGWAAQRLAGLLDTRDPRVYALLVMGAGVLLAGLSLWAQPEVSLTLCALGLLRVGLTGAAALALHAMIARRWGGAAA
jgi:hypothetical protein